MTLIDLQDVHYSYSNHSLPADRVTALAGISLRIASGEFVALLGRSGAGKSTLARLLNALLLPTSGSILIDGMDTRDRAHLWEVRRRVGLLFPEPQNQIVGTTVAEDVAFGPENLGWPPETISAAVQSALETVGMIDYGQRAPHLLSDLLKCKLALAGILAMKPSCVVVDEATARLSHEERNEFLALLRALNRETGLTVVLLNSLAEEVACADRIITLEAGRIIVENEANMDRSPATLLQNAPEKPVGSEPLC
jgi:energy-coupling factor transporter ATP-binding protein EcfA2